jgi:hypothetical protein
MNIFVHIHFKNKTKLRNFNFIIWFILCKFWQNLFREVFKSISGLKKLLVQIPEVGAGAFFALLRFRAREREAKKRARKREEKRVRKKAKALCAKEKSANSRFFLPPQWKSGFRAQSRSAGGKAMVLSKTIQ